MIILPLYSRISSISRVFSRASGVNLLCKTRNVATFKFITRFSTPVFEIKNFPLPFNTYRYMAGHAKWQNVKHIKAEKDKLKANLCNKYVRLVTAAVREKGPDPKSNNRLANIFEEARRNNIPSQTIENAIKRGCSKKLQSGTIEMLGPGGFILIFEYETENISDMRRSIKVICRKYSCGIYPANSERWRAVYDQKGIIRVSKQLSGESIDNEKMLDAAIEAGAEDVQRLEEENLYEFLCAPEDINNVKKELEQKFAVEEAYVGYLPTCTVPLSEEEKTLAMNFLNDLSELPDTTKMYENIE